MVGLTELQGFPAIPADADADVLTELEAAATAFVERYTHRHFGAVATFTEAVRGSRGPKLWLDQAAVAVTSVHAQPYEGGTQTEIVAADDDGFVIRDGVLVRKRGLWWADAEYVVVYDAGYTLNDAGPPADVAAPDDIRQAVRLIVAHWYGVGKVGASTDPTAPSGITSENLGDYGYSLGSGAGVAATGLAAGATTLTLLDTISGLKATLESYRRLYI